MQSAPDPNKSNKGKQNAHFYEKLLCILLWATVSCVWTLFICNNNYRTIKYFFIRLGNNVQSYKISLGNDFIHCK